MAADRLSFRPTLTAFEPRLAPAALVGTQATVNSEAAGNQILPSVSTFAGGFVTVWQDDATGGGGLFGRIAGADGTPIGTQFRIAAAGATTPQVTGLSGGGFVVAWQQSSAIFAQAFRPDTSAVGGPFRVDAGASGSNREPSVAGLADGGFVVGWERSLSVVSRRFDALGAATSAEAVIDSDELVFYGVSVRGLPGGNYVVAHLSYDPPLSSTGPFPPLFTVFRLYDAAGTEVAGSTVGIGQDPEVVSLSDGGFVVAFLRTENRIPAGVAIQKYSASGQAVGSVMPVSSTTSAIRGPISGTGLSTGGFALAYVSLAYDGSGAAVLSLELDASGNRVGNEIVVGSIRDGDQTTPSATLGRDGRYAVAYASQALDGSGFGIALQRVTPDALNVAPNPTPNPTPSGVVKRFAYGSARGVASAVSVFDANGGLVGELQPFGAAALGTTVATADVNGDGTEDIIAGLGAGGLPLVVVYDGISLQQVSAFFAFDPNFRGGVNVAAGDLDGDGRAEIVAGAGLGSFPIARVLDGQSGAEEGAFFAFDQAFRGGVSVAVADLTGDNKLDVAAGAGPGGVPVVAGFDGRTFAQTGAAFALDVAFRGGVFVGAGDVTGDKRGDVIVGAGPGGVPVVRVFDALTFQDQNPFFAADVGFPGGVAVAVVDPRNTGTGAIAVGFGAGVIQAAAFDATKTPPQQLAAPVALKRQVVFGTLPPTPEQAAALARGDFAALFAG